MHKRALYISAKEPYISAKRALYIRKRALVSEPLTAAPSSSLAQPRYAVKELCISAKEPYISAKRALYIRKRALYFHQKALWNIL